MYEDEPAYKRSSIQPKQHTTNKSMKIVHENATRLSCFPSREFPPFVLSIKAKSLTILLANIPPLRALTFAQVIPICLFKDVTGKNARKHFFVEVNNRRVKYF